MHIHGTAQILQREHKQPVVAVKLVADPLPSPATYHIALLLDTSGSMENDGLPAVITTLHRLVDTLRDGTVLSVVTYASVGRILANAVVLCPETRDDLHSVFGTLVADGSTNLESAMEALGQIVASDVEPIASVFLLTDGHVNTGICHSAGLLRLLAARLPKGTQVNTLGFGADHNAAMLRDMAIQSRGSYTYADVKEMIPAIVGDIVGGLDDLVAKHTCLQAPAGFRCIEMGADPTMPTEAFLGNLVANKPEWCLFEAPTVVSGQKMLLTFETPDCQGTLQVINIGPVSPAEVVDVVEQCERVEVATTFRQVSDMLAERRTDNAIQELTRLQTHLANSVAKHTSFVLRLQANVDEMLQAIHRQGMVMHDPDMDGNIDPMNSVLTRLVSNTTTLATQRGYVSNVDSLAEDFNNISIFSTPRQRHTSQTLSLVRN